MIIIPLKLFGENLEDDSAVAVGYKSDDNAEKKNLFVDMLGFNITGENNVILGNSTTLLVLQIRNRW